MCEGTTFHSKRKSLFIFFTNKYLLEVCPRQIPSPRIILLQYLATSPTSLKEASCGKPSAPVRGCSGMGLEGGGGQFQRLGQGVERLVAVLKDLFQNMLLPLREGRGQILLEFLPQGGGELFFWNGRLPKNGQWGASPWYLPKIWLFTVMAATRPASSAKVGVTVRCISTEDLFFKTMGTHTVYPILVRPGTKVSIWSYSAKDSAA